MMKLAPKQQQQQQQQRVQFKVDDDESSKSNYTSNHHHFYQNDETCRKKMNSADDKEKKSIFSRHHSLLKPLNANQTVETIVKETSKQFSDVLFRPSLNLIVVDHSSPYCHSLFAFFDCKNKFDLNELSSHIKWERCQVNKY